MPPKPKLPILRFLKLVQYEDNGCWRWMGSLGTRSARRGYARFSERTNHTVDAYKWIWEYIHGPVPSGLELDHLCRNHWCVAPYHLEAVTHTINVRRGVRGQMWRDYHARRTHCVKGHELTTENVRFQRMTEGYTKRKCRTCERAACKQYAERRKLRASTFVGRTVPLPGKSD